MAVSSTPTAAEHSHKQVMLVQTRFSMAVPHQPSQPSVSQEMSREFSQLPMEEPTEVPRQPQEQLHMARAPPMPSQRLGQSDSVSSPMVPEHHTGIPVRRLPRQTSGNSMDQAMLSPQ